MTNPENQRRFTRAELKARIDWGQDQTEFSGYTENISEGGVFVATAKPLPIGEPIQLDVELRDGTVAAIRARVAWIRETDEDAGVFGGMGIQFVDPPDELTESIRAFIDTGDDSILLFHAEG
jgi:uncharacterized protein (TIGR02266 family)